MMNKKAITVKALIAMLVAIAVLAIVYFFLIGPGKNIIIDKPDIILPGFNTNKTPIEDTQIIGYNIQSDTVEYFTGIEWVRIRDPIELGDKEINPIFPVCSFSRGFPRQDQTLFHDFWKSLKKSYVVASYWCTSCFFKQKRK